MQKLSALVVGAACVAALSGCGGSASSTVTGASNPRVVAVNAFATTQTVDVWYNQDKIAAGLSFGQVSPQAIEPNDSPTIQFRDSVTQGVVTQATGHTFQLNTNYAVIGTTTPASGGTAASPTVMVVRLEAQPLSGQAQVRFLTSTPTFGNVDVYVTAPGASLSGTTPSATVTINALNPIGTATAQIPLAPGSYEIRVFPAGAATSTTPLCTLASVSLQANQNRSFVLAADSMAAPSLIQVNDTGP